ALEHRAGGGEVFQIVDGRDVRHIWIRGEEFRNNTKSNKFLVSSFEFRVQKSWPGDRLPKVTLEHRAGGGEVFQIVDGRDVGHAGVRGGSSNSNTNTNSYKFLVSSFEFLVQKSWPGGVAR
ncbi:MAG: hypothetical protein ABFD69_02015, partial [Candidatus Sumerlaeia bacterium]